MVSHLQFHLEMEEIVACPFCGGLAKKELLEEWLEKKRTCPICRRKMLNSRNDERIKKKMKKKKNFGLSYFLNPLLFSEYNGYNG